MRSGKHGVSVARDDVSVGVVEYVVLSLTIPFGSIVRLTILIVRCIP